MLLIPLGQQSIARTESPALALRAAAESLFDRANSAQLPLIELTTTVGINSGICAGTDFLNIEQPTQVYYCYTVRNTGDVTFTQHTIQNPLVAERSFSFDLPPGEPIIQISEGILISATIDNEVTWVASTISDTARAEDSDSALVVVSAPDLTVQQTVGLDPRACGTESNIIVPAGVDVYFCVTIENTGDTTLRSHQIDAPALGISLQFDFVLEPGVILTLFEESLSTFGITESFAIKEISNDVESTVTVVSTTGDGVDAGGEDTAGVDTEGRIDVLVWKQVSTVPDGCGPVSSVFVETVVYYCLVVTNLGSSRLSQHQLVDPQLNLNVTVQQDILSGDTFEFTADVINSAPGVEGSFGPYTVTTPIQNTLYYTASVSNGFSVSEIVSNVLSIATPTLVEPSITPTPTETGTPTLTPTNTSTRRPPNTATPFPTNTPAPTLSPTPVPLPPTHTPISPPPTPTSTPTTLIARIVETPTAFVIAADTGATTVAQTATANVIQTQAVAAAETQQAGTNATATAAAANSILPSPTLTPPPVDPGPAPTGTSTLTPTPTESPTPTFTSTYAPRATSTLIAPPTLAQTNTDPTQVAAIAMGAERPLVRQTPLPPSSYAAYMAQLFNAMIVTAGFLWFFCGSLLFFVSAGLITGFYFRRQERNRYQLIRVPDAEESTPITGSGAVTSARADYQWEYDDGSGSGTPRREGNTSSGSTNSGSTPRASSNNDQSTDDNWPASLP